MRSKETIKLLMCRYERSVPISCAFQENVWCHLVADKIRSRIQYGDSEGWGAPEALAYFRGETMRSSVHGQRGLFARHRHRTRLRLRSPGHSAYEKCWSLHESMWAISSSLNFNYIKNISINPIHSYSSIKHSWMCHKF